jgi:hypothetical protein
MGEAWEKIGKPYEMKRPSLEAATKKSSEVHVCDHWSVCESDL